MHCLHEFVSTVNVNPQVCTESAYKIKSNDGRGHAPRSRKRRRKRFPSFAPARNARLHACANSCHCDMSGLSPESSCCAETDEDFGCLSSDTEDQTIACMRTNVVSNVNLEYHDNGKENDRSSLSAAASLPCLHVVKTPLWPTSRFHLNQRRMKDGSMPVLICLIVMFLCLLAITCCFDCDFNPRMFGSRLHYAHDCLFQWKTFGSCAHTSSCTVNDFDKNDFRFYRCALGWLAVSDASENAEGPKDRCVVRHNVREGTAHGCMIAASDCGGLACCGFSWLVFNCFRHSCALFAECSPCPFGAEGPNERSVSRHGVREGTARRIKISADYYDGLSIRLTFAPPAFRVFVVLLAIRSFHSCSLSFPQNFFWSHCPHSRNHEKMR